MDTKKSFLSDTRFIASAELFPYGISRSGDFTVTQVELLEQHGNAYHALQHGLREPINDEEAQFIDVFKGERTASSKHELVWKRFLEKTTYRIKITSFSKNSSCNDDFAGISEEEW